MTDKVENIWEDSLDSIPSPSPSVKIQNIGGKVYFRQFKSLLTTPSNVLTLHLKQIFLLIIWIFTKVMDGIQAIFLNIFYLLYHVWISSSHLSTKWQYQIGWMYWFEFWIQILWICVFFLFAVWNYVSMEKCKVEQKKTWTSGGHS